MDQEHEEFNAKTGYVMGEGEFKRLSPLQSLKA
jgi:hypothetical protein